MKNNIKYYVEQPNTEKKYFSHWPYWVSGNDYQYGINSYTRNINEADFVCIYFPNIYIQQDNSEIIFELSEKKKLNPNLKVIVLNKEELLFDYTYKFIKDIREQNLFTKNEVIVSSPNINVVENNLYTHLPPKLWIGPWLSRNRYNIWDSEKPNIETLIDELNKENIIKNKKLISSSRKYGLFRDAFFNSILNHPHLFNKDNTLRYYGMFPNDDLRNFDKLNSIFKDNSSYDLVSSELMVNSPFKFYLNLLKDYAQHYFTIVGETFPDTTTISNSYDEFQISEKVFLPMITKNILFVNHKSGFENLMQNVGIQSFEGMFDIYYDILSPEDKVKKLTEIAHKINSLSYTEIEKIYTSDEVQSRLQSNYDYIIYWANEKNQKNEHENFLNQFINEF